VRLSAPPGIGKAVAEIDSLPGCSQVGVVHAAFVDPLSRSRGVGYEAHCDRLEWMKTFLLYDLALATVCEENEAQIKIMQKAGWTKATTFVSRKTGHNVGLWFRKLEDKILR